MSITKYILAIIIVLILLVFFKNEDSYQVVYNDRIVSTKVMVKAKYKKDMDFFENLKNCKL